MIEATPCVKCGTTGGDPVANSHRPARVRTDRFGVPGVACHGCYHAMSYRFRVGRDPLTGARLTEEAHAR